MQLAYLPDRKREYIIDDDAGSCASELSMEGRDDVTNLDELVKDYKRNRRRGMLGWFKLSVSSDMYFPVLLPSAWGVKVEIYFWTMVVVKIEKCRMTIVLLFQYSSTFYMYASLKLYFPKTYCCQRHSYLPVCFTVLP